MSYSRGRPIGAVRVILGALFGAAFLLASAAPVAAHTALKASSPEAGGRIDVAPSQVVLEFTEPIFTTGFSVAVRGPDGRSYQSGSAQVSSSKLLQALRPLGPAGVYQVQFRVVAADGHPLVSEMQFTLTKPGPAAAGPGAASARPAPTAAVRSLTTANDAPGWAPWTAAVAAVIFVSGAVLIGRRVTHGID